MQRVRWWQMVMVFGLATVETVASQQVVGGRVVDRESRAGIPGARIVIDGTNVSTQTNADGRFSARVTGTGSGTIRVFAVGYQPTSRVVPLGEATALEFEMSPTVVRLDEIVTTASGDQRRLELGTTVGVVQADSLVGRATINNVVDVLNSRVAGVSVQSLNGTLGAGSRVRIRGANSISLSNEPIVVIDGVRVNTQPASNSIGVGGQASSRFDDLNPNDIAAIEVIKGPSAATLYGTEAANGVISIRTKRGRAGAPVWNGYVESGLIEDHNAYPDNFNAWGLRAGQQRAGCFLYRVASGVCAAQDSIVTKNPLRDPVTSPFATGYRGLVGLNVSGGTEVLRYFLAADVENNIGTYRLPVALRDSVIVARGIEEVPGDQLRPSATRKVSFRSNVTANVAPTVEIDASVGYLQNKVRLPQNDNNIFGVLGNGLLGSAVDPNGLWAVGIDPAASFSHTNEQLIDRVTTALTTKWLPSPNVTGRLVLGLDRTLQTDVDVGRVGEAPNFFNDARGTRSLNKFTTGIYSIDGALTAQTSLTRTIGSKTTVGGQYYRTTLNGTLATGNGIAAGSNTIGGAAQLLAASQNTTVANGGLYLEEVLSWDDRLFVTGAARLDQASAFARSEGAILLPKAAVSFIAVNNPNGWLNLVRLRGAFGQSLVAPGALVRLRAFQPVTGVAPGGINVPAVTFGNLGNDALKPERSREFEAGIDGSFFGDRLSVELTGFDKFTKDALVNRVLAPSLGAAGAQFFNIGSMKNQGIELSLTTQLVKGRTVSADVAIVGSLLKNRLVALGEGIEPFPIGFTQRMVPGLPAGGHWDRIARFDDANGDGLIAVGEITVSDTAEYIGPSQPTRELSVVPSVSLWNGRVRISSQWNYRGGYFLDNSTEGFRCSAFGNCQALYDRTLPLDQQAFATANWVLGGFNGYVQQADFVKLREVNVVVAIPSRLTAAIGAKSASLTLSGRNLATWTKYRGLDPETSAFNGANFGTSDFLTQPPVRFWTARINLGF